MMTQNDLFEPAAEIAEHTANDQDSEGSTAQLLPIAVPCGFTDRHNNRCQRLGNWPVMADGKQMACRGQPMVHCDPACFRGETPVKAGGMDDDEIVWEDRLGEYGDEQPD